MFTVQDFRDTFTGRPHGIQGVKGRFAVLVPLVEIEGQAHLLYELRSAHIDRQPGEVCFPGGEIEPGETPLQAAIRETWEETGIPADRIDVISELDTLHPPSNIVIYPFLAEISRDALDDLKLSECEVAECFLVPVSFLETAPYIYNYSIDNRLGSDFQYQKIGLSGPEYNWRPMKHQIISWQFENKYIWGLTAQITKWTLDILKEGHKALGNPLKN
ncbi:MAG: CoA pyrophosphatase [Parasporobacterium sp.]|nr:CoA pyrophosphatase [Parasporobacterium sp.]